MLKIAVCGEGPVALSVAAVCGRRGHIVRVLAARPARWRDWIAGSLPNGTIFAGAVDIVTSDARTAVAGADLVFICVSHAAKAETLRRLAPHVSPDALVGAIPGFGGFGPIARR